MFVRCSGPVHAHRLAVVEGDGRRGGRVGQDLDHTIHHKRLFLVSLPFGPASRQQITLICRMESFTKARMGGS